MSCGQDHLVFTIEKTLAMSHLFCKVNQWFFTLCRPVFMHRQPKICKPVLRTHGIVWYWVLMDVQTPNIGWMDLAVTLSDYWHVINTSGSPYICLSHTSCHMVVAPKECLYQTDGRLPYNLSASWLVYLLYLSVSCHLLFVLAPSCSVLSSLWEL